jgi:membrane associated rhomboid family serine protease
MPESRSNRPSLQGAPFTASFMAICVVVFLAGLTSPANEQWIFIRFSHINAAVAAGQWWRLFTSAFLHGGAVHILFNMWALVIFGPPLERSIGSAAFGATVLACAAWGGTAAYLLAGPRYAAVGASGAIFGVFGVWLYASYLSRQTPMGQAQFRNLATQLAINAFLAISVPRISWQGHVGGLAAGIAIAAVWRRMRPPISQARRTQVAIAAAVLAVAVVLVVPR